MDHARIPNRGKSHHPGTATGSLTKLTGHKYQRTVEISDQPSNFDQVRTNPRWPGPSHEQQKGDADQPTAVAIAGAAVVNFTVASTPRYFDRDAGEWKDGDPLFLRCNLWRQAAENLAESLSRGARVIVMGRLKQRSFTTREGDKRTVVELDVDEVGASLRYATATVTRATANGSGGPRTRRAVTTHRDGFGNPDTDTSTGFDQPTASASGGEDPWREPAMAGAAAGFGDDAPPF
ncbi:single-stranded DNA-binding protein [Nocardia africana]|uniref:single-stranded DNA-binding protein n=1 Tax=Nocardia africana TaxID=134964 RepID=UPI0027E1A1F4|nr:single-stranded DNA-binding protein [Nocardia africana]